MKIKRFFYFVLLVNFLVLLSSCGQRPKSDVPVETYPDNGVTVTQRIDGITAQLHQTCLQKQQVAPMPKALGSGQIPEGAERVKLLPTDVTFTQAIILGLRSRGYQCKLISVFEDDKGVPIVEQIDLLFLPPKDRLCDGSGITFGKALFAVTGQGYRQGSTNTKDGFIEPKLHVTLGGACSPKETAAFAQLLILY